MGDKAAVDVERQFAVPGITLPVRCIDDKKTFAADGDVQGIPRGLHRPFLEIARQAEIHHEQDLILTGPVAADALGPFLKMKGLGLEGRGVQIGKIVGDHIKGPPHGHLTGKIDQPHILHRPIPPVVVLLDLSSQPSCQTRRDAFPAFHATVDAVCGQSGPGKSCRGAEPAQLHGP